MLSMDVVRERVEINLWKQRSVMRGSVLLFVLMGLWILAMQPLGVWDVFGGPQVRFDDERLGVFWPVMVGGLEL